MQFSIMLVRNCVFFMFQLMDTLRSPFQCLKSKQKQNRKHLNSLKFWGHFFNIVHIQHLHWGSEEKSLLKLCMMPQILNCLRIHLFMFYCTQEMKTLKVWKDWKETNQMLVSRHINSLRSSIHSGLHLYCRLWHVGKGAANICCVQ